MWTVIHCQKLKIQTAENRRGVGLGNAVFSNPCLMVRNLRTNFHISPDRTNGVV